MKTTSSDTLELSELPVSPRTVAVGDEFMISDNLDSSDPIDILRLTQVSKVGVLLPFKLRFTMSLICLAGTMRMRLLMKEHVLGPGSMITIAEGSIGECLEISADARLVMIGFSASLKVFDNAAMLMPEIHSIISRRPLIALTDDELADFRAVYGILRRRLAEKDFMMKREFARMCVRTFYCYMSGVLLDDSTPVRPQSRRQKAFERFLALVEANFTEHRDIAFYASQMGMSAKYLGRLIVEMSGLTAKAWINERMLLEAKVRLKEESGTVQQIADELGFPNQSFFGSWFRRSTGMTPGAYRGR